MAESTLETPPSRGFRINPVLLIIGLVVLALVVIVSIDVIHILEGQVQEGDHIIVDVNAEGDGLQFTTVPQTEVDAV